VRPQDGRWNRMPCMTTARDKAVPSGALHSADIRTNTSEGRRRALSPASDPWHIPFSVGQVYAARPHRSPPRGSHSAYAQLTDPARARRHDPRACWSPDTSRAREPARGNQPANPRKHERASFAKLLRKDRAPTELPRCSSVNSTTSCGFVPARETIEQVLRVPETAKSVP
jgi:hypothetical protein